MSLAGWATIAAVAVGVQVGAATTVSRFVVGSLEPATFAVLRGLERLNIARLLGVVLTILGVAVMVVGKLMTQQRD